jgi:hypothetical protein
MPAFNAITGLKRKLPRNRLSRKKRASHSSTVAARTYASEAMDNFEEYMKATTQYMSYFFVIQQINHESAAGLATICLLFAAFFFSKAGRMLQLDSDLMDIEDEVVETSGYHKELVGVTLDSFANDDECEDKTRFKKAEIQEHLFLPELLTL